MRSELELFFAGVDEDRPPRRRPVLERLCDMVCGVSLPVRVSVDSSPPASEAPADRRDRPARLS